MLEADSYLIKQTLYSFGKGYIYLGVIIKFLYDQFHICTTKLVSTTYRK